MGRLPDEKLKRGAPRGYEDMQIPTLFVSRSADTAPHVRQADYFAIRGGASSTVLEFVDPGFRRA